jgi:hypothetical protein
VRTFKTSWGAAVDAAEDLERLTLFQLSTLYGELTGKERTFPSRRVALGRCARALESWRGRVWSTSGRPRGLVSYQPSRALRAEPRRGGVMERIVLMLGEGTTLAGAARELGTSERGALQRIREVRKIGYGLREDPETGVIRLVQP